MGTNYYVKLNHCKCCERSDDIHIGRSSWGWAFYFRGYKNTYGEIETDNYVSIEVPKDFELVSWEQWKAYLHDKIIVDEYGQEQPYDEFVQYVEQLKAPGTVTSEGKNNLDHITEMKKDVHQKYSVDKDWHDSMGYSFSNREFR